MAPEAFEKLIELGVVAHQAGRLEEALGRYRAAVAILPEDAEAQSLLGLVLVHLDRPMEAEPALLKAVELEPQQAAFHLNLAEFLEKTGQFERMAAQIGKALAQQPELSRGWIRLGDASVSLERLTDAASAYERSLAIDPRNAATAAKLARVRASLGAHSEALQALDIADRIRPDHQAQFELRAEILTVRRDWKTLQAVSRAWLANHPKSVEAWRNLATAALEQGWYRLSADAYRNVIENSPKSANNLSAYASICLRALDLDAAAAALAEAEALDPDLGEMLSAKASLLTYFGRMDEAETYCRRALSGAPDNISAYTILSLLKRGHLADHEMAAVSSLAKQGELSKENRALAAFALGDGHDARGEMDAAFEAYEYAHAIYRECNRAEGAAYDFGESGARCDRLIQLFSALPAPIGTSGRRPKPIFIVGMPRSGTTLIESVLSAQSRVFACGERPRMQQILNTYLSQAGGQRQIPSQTLQDWRDAYLHDVPPCAGADYITDKFPLNFESAGLIAQLFPEATIINVRRNPMETGLSIFRHAFPRFLRFTESLESIGDFYGQYARLVAHWERICFSSRFITVQYEDFAANFDRAAPKLLEACGLQWEEACANFQSVTRSVATFSAVQVREPVRLQSGRAELYEKHLAPLRRQLEVAGVDPKTGALRVAVA